MTVAVQENLQHLQEQLRTLGYEVVPYGSYHHPVDAVVYLSRSSGQGGIISGGRSCLPSENPVLFVNAEGKTAGEISAMLQRKLYTSLF